MSDDSTLNQRVAEEIRVMLARRNMTATELARQAGMTQRSVSRRITGEKAIDMDDLEAFAKVFEVQVGDLLPQPALRDERAHRGGASDRPPNHPRDHQLTRPRSTRLTAGTTHTSRPAESDSATAVTSRTRTDRPVIRPWRHEGVAAA